MSDTTLKYEPVLPKDKVAIEALLRSKEATDIADALYAAARYESDWQWVQNECIRRLNDSAASVRWAAATCLGDLAFRRFPLELDLVIPALEAASREPAIADPALFSLSIVRQFA